MSKIFPRFFLPLLAAAFIVACIRIPKQPQTTDPDTTPLTYRFDGGADLTALFTLQASYIAADGRTQTEQIASLPWAKEVGVSAPFGARLDVRFRKKADYPRQDVYAVGFSGGIDCASANAAIPPPLGLSRAGGAGFRTGCPRTTFRCASHPSNTTNISRLHLPATIPMSRLTPSSGA